MNEIVIFKENVLILLSCLAQSPAWVVASCVLFPELLMSCLLFSLRKHNFNIGIDVNNGFPPTCYQYMMISVSKTLVFKSLSAIFRLHSKECEFLFAEWSMEKFFMNWLLQKEEWSTLVKNLLFSGFIERGFCILGLLKHVSLGFTVRRLICILMIVKHVLVRVILKQRLWFQDNVLVSSTTCLDYGIMCVSCLACSSVWRNSIIVLGFMSIIGYDMLSVCDDFSVKSYSVWKSVNNLQATFKRILSCLCTMKHGDVLQEFVLKKG